HNWHHAPIIARATELVRAREIGRVTRVVWHTLRTQAAGAHNGNGSNWRLDPALAGGGILTDHGWHAFYLVGSWITETPTSLSARDRKSTRLNSSHVSTSYAVFCLKN